MLLKIAFYWLNAKAYGSMAKMKAINPKIMEMRERLKDKPQQMQQEMMRIYREEKVNPLGGCLPILVQMPVFIALYWVLLSSVEMRNAPWIGWITTFSAPDPYFILPLLMTVTSLLQTWLNPTPPDPMQAKMMWFMPLVFSVMFFFFPAGLVLYWMTNNILSIAQQYVINKRLGVLGKSAPCPRAAGQSGHAGANALTSRSPPSPRRPGAARSASCASRGAALEPLVAAVCGRLPPRAARPPAFPRRAPARRSTRAWRSIFRRRIPTPAKTCSSCRRTAARWCCSCCWRAAWKRRPRRSDQRLPDCAARPGEFTERAFLNDKLDLAQAEAVADLIDASTEAAARSAGRSLTGAFSTEINALRDQLIELRMLVEATLDFPEEEIDFLEKADARGQLDRPTRAARSTPCCSARARARCCAKASRS